MLSPGKVITRPMWPGSSFHIGSRVVYIGDPWNLAELADHAAASADIRGLVDRGIFRLRVARWLKVAQREEAR